MVQKNQTYTYMAGKKVILNKRPDEFVVRILPLDLDKIGVESGQQMSSLSTRVSVAPKDLEQNMAQARSVTPTHHAYELADTKEEFLITDRIFVVFKNPVSDESLDNFVNQYALIRKNKYSDTEYLFQLTSQTGMNPVKLVVILSEENSLVDHAEHDLNFRAATYQFTNPTDPSYEQQWHLHRKSTHAEFDIRSSSDCDKAWSVLDGMGSKDVIVAVADDGCKLDHPDFDSGDKFAGWGYFQNTRLVKNIDIDANPSDMYIPGSNHGTSCCGVIAGEADAVLTVGAAPGCRLIPIKWESDGPSLFISTSKLRTAIDYIADKADIMSNSWGSSPTSYWPGIIVNRIKGLAKTGGPRGKGIVFLWAAGNENCPIQHTADVDVPYNHGWKYNQVSRSWEWDQVPTSRIFSDSLANVQGVMHIAALASTAKRSHYSNYGNGISLCAPSSNSHSYYRMTVKGLGVTTTTGDSGGLTHDFGGTSSATPLVAGIAALIISANSNLTALEVISLLKQTASKDLDMEGYPRTPPASYDMDTSWDVSPIEPFSDANFADIGSEDGNWSPWFGHGKVDAPVAVAKALELRQGNLDTLSYSSFPEVPIPDNDIQGIVNEIDVIGTGSLQSIKVQVQIKHTWIGDLTVRLISPSGTNVILHDRSGSSSDNITKTYELINTPGMGALKDREINGKWMLQVQDTADQDNGFLQSWSLEFNVFDSTLIVEDANSERIPDSTPQGITKTLSINDDRKINQLTVAVDITHPWIGDLTVDLIMPNGLTVPLHNRSGRSRDNINQTWTSISTKELQSMLGQSAKGQWQLKVADHASRDIGKLNTWRIEIV